MTASWFHVPELPAGDDFVLDGPEGHHAATVQRLRVGEELVLGDGRGNTASATVTAVGRGQLSVRLGQRTFTPQPSPRFVVVQGIAKGDRGELAVQAMTEVGVDEIVPWAASRSIAKWKDDRPRQRWADTAREAAKQARRPWVPAVVMASVPELLQSATLALVLHESASTPLSTVEVPTDGDVAGRDVAGHDVVLVVGPEGGITDDELASFVAVGARPVRLGFSVLRTSTAGPAALAVLNVASGRW